MIRQILITTIVVLSVSGVMPGADDAAKTEQELFHIWTPEPELATAIACQDNDFGCDHPDDPNKHKEVPLPASVKTAICKLTHKTFEDELYEGPVRYAEMFGPVYRITVPHSNDLYLYVYQLDCNPAFHWISFIIVLHNVKSDKISSVPLSFGKDIQSYCTRPWIRFQDVIGDSTDEIILLTGEHNGNSVRCMHQHIIQIESGINLHELGSIKTGDWSPSLYINRTRVEGSEEGFIVRTINKMDNNRLIATVFYSKNKDKLEGIMLGIEVYEMLENKVLHRTTSYNAKGEIADKIVDGSP